MTLTKIFHGLTEAEAWAITATEGVVLVNVVKVRTSMLLARRNQLLSFLPKCLSTQVHSVQRIADFASYQSFARTTKRAFERGNNPLCIGAPSEWKVLTERVVIASSVEDLCFNLSFDCTERNSRFYLPSVNTNDVEEARTALLSTLRSMATEHAPVVIFPSSRLDAIPLVRVRKLIEQSTNPSLLRKMQFTATPPNEETCQRASKLVAICGTASPSSREGLEKLCLQATMRDKLCAILFQSAQIDYLFIRLIESYGVRVNVIEPSLLSDIQRIAKTAGMTVGGNRSATETTRYICEQIALCITDIVRNTDTNP